MRRALLVFGIALILCGAWECCHADAKLDSHVVSCHRKYWEKQSGRWTYVVCVFPDGSTDLFMRVPEHAYSSPIITPDSTRRRLELMSPAVIQIPDLEPIAPPDFDEDDDDSSSPQEEPKR